MQPQKRRRWIRSTAAVAVVLLAVLAATPSFLVRSGYLRRILNKKPEKFLLSYASATAPWPWQIVANGLEIRGADPNVEWWFRMERADLKISLFGLLRRRFHVRTLRVEGLRFRLRQRVKREERDAAAVAPLPEIPGFGEVPVKGGAPFFPPPEPPSHYWAVAIDDLVAPASEIWIDQYRYQGPARVTGGFFLWPRKETHIGPASVDFEGGRLSLGENIMAELKKEGSPAHHVEGLEKGRWVLLDFVDFVVHIFHPTLRNFYQLERLWADAEEVPLDRGAGMGA